jgi:hypothetical protein
MIGSADLGSIPGTNEIFQLEFFKILSTLTDLNWIVSMVKSDFMDTYTITDSSCGSKSKWALVHLCTCKAAAHRSNVYVSGKNTKKCSLCLRHCKVYQPARGQRKKGAKKKINLYPEKYLNESRKNDPI